MLPHYFLLFFLFATTACAGSQAGKKDQSPKPSDNTESLAGIDLGKFEHAQIIETIDATHVSLACTGEGVDPQAAILVCRAGCLDWFVTRHIATGAEEKKAYHKLRPKLFAQLDKYVEPSRPGSRSGSGRGIMSKTRMDSNRVKVRLITALDTRAIRDALGVVGASHPPKSMTLIVMPKKGSPALKLKSVVESTIIDHLSKAGFEVMAMQSADPSANPGLKFDAAVEFEVIRQASGETVTYTISISVLDRSSGKILAQKSGTGPARFAGVAGGETKALLEACTDVIGYVTRQLKQLK